MTVLVAAVLVAAVVYGVYKTWSPRDNCKVLSTQVLEDGTHIEIVNDECKEGLPHTTTRDTVRMKQGLRDSSRFEETMVHERVHLDQKTRPEYWKELIKKVWSYDISKKPPPGLPSEWVALRRPNPDTDGEPWATWRGRYVFFAAYGDDKRLSTATTRVWDLETSRLVETPPEWRAQFCHDGCPHQSEHPYEIAAEFITLKSQSPASAALSSAL